MASQRGQTLRPARGGKLFPRTKKDENSNQLGRRYFIYLSESLELLQFTFPQGPPQEDFVLLFEGFVIAFSFSELLFKFRNTFLITFLGVILDARNLVLYSSAKVAPLEKGHLVITQFLEWYAGRVKLHGQGRGERTRV